MATLTDNNATTIDTPRDLPAWLWLWFPPFMIVLLIVFVVIDPARVEAMMNKEGGLVEHATVAALAPGILAGFYCLRFRRDLPRAWLAGWYLLWALAMIYFAGEEISWGQHYFGWKTPPALDNVNDQGETNLHNMSSWLDQKPRAMVELWIVIGGLIIPAIRRWRRERPDPARVSYWFWPTSVGAVAAGCMIASRVIHELNDAAQWERLDRLASSELREYYIALFLSLQLLSACVRLNQVHVARELLRRSSG